MTAPSGMLVTHRKEDFSIAYIRAIAAKAGFNIWQSPSHDYGTDIIFSSVSLYQTLSKKRGKRHSDVHNVPLFCQVKSSKNWKLRGDDIAYHLEAQAFDDLIQDKSRVLILMCLPSSETEWLNQDEECLQLHHCCYYWFPANGEAMTPNDNTKLILIPRTQIFTPESLTLLVNEGRQRMLRRGIRI